MYSAYPPRRDPPQRPAVPQPQPRRPPLPSEVATQGVWCPPAPSEATVRPHSPSPSYSDSEDEGEPGPSTDFSSTAHSSEEPTHQYSIASCLSAVSDSGTGRSEEVPPMTTTAGIAPPPRGGAAGILVASPSTESSSSPPPAASTPPITPPLNPTLPPPPRGAAAEAVSEGQRKPNFKDHIPNTQLAPDHPESAPLEAPRGGERERVAPPISPTPKMPDESDFRCAISHVKRKVARPREGSMLDKRLARIGLERRATKPDGNCMYRAFADQLGHPDRWQEVKSRIFQRMTNDPKYREQFASEIMFDYASFSDYIAVKAHGTGSRSWGGHPEMIVAIDEFKAKITVFTYNGCYSVGGDGLERAWRIAFVGQNHYDSVVLGQGGAASFSQHEAQTRIMRSLKIRLPGGRQIEREVELFDDGCLYDFVSDAMGDSSPFQLLISPVNPDRSPEELKLLDQEVFQKVVMKNNPLWLVASSYATLQRAPSNPTPTPTAAQAGEKPEKGKKMIDGVLGMVGLGGKGDKGKPKPKTPTAANGGVVFGVVIENGNLLCEGTNTREEVWFNNILAQTGDLMGKNKPLLCVITPAFVRLYRPRPEGIAWQCKFESAAWKKSRLHPTDRRNFCLVDMSGVSGKSIKLYSQDKRASCKIQELLPHEEKWNAYRPAMDELERGRNQQQGQTPSAAPAPTPTPQPNTPQAPLAKSPLAIQQHPQKQPPKQQPQQLVHSTSSSSNLSGGPTDPWSPPVWSSPAPMMNATGGSNRQARPNPRNAMQPNGRPNVYAR